MLCSRAFASSFLPGLQSKGGIWTVGVCSDRLCRACAELLPELTRKSNLAHMKELASSPTLELTQSTSCVFCVASDPGSS